MICLPDLKGNLEIKKIVRIVIMKLEKKHYTLLECHYFANDDNYVEAMVDINTDKSMSLIVGDYYGDSTDEIKINYCPMCGRKL